MTEDETRQAVEQTLAGEWEQMMVLQYGPDGKTVIGVILHLESCPLCATPIMLPARGDARPRDHFKDQHIAWHVGQSA